MRRGVLLVSIGLLLFACSSEEANVVTLSEFEIDAPGVLTAGSTTLSVVNDGEFPHSLVVSEADGTVVTSSPVLQPGTTTELDFTLGPGEYEFTCRIVVDVLDVGLVDHYAEGMDTAVTVEG